MTKQEENDWKAWLLLALLLNADKETIEQLKSGNKKLKDLIPDKLKEK